MPKDAAAAAKLRRAIAFSALATLIVFCAFAVYAFTAPATYRAVAVVQVEPGTAPGRWASPAEAARRVREAAVDEELVEWVGKEAVKGESPAARAAAASRLLSGFDVSSSDGRRFQLSLRGPQPAVLELLGNSLADRVAARAPGVLAAGLVPDDRARSAVRDKRVAELTAFLAAHPELATESGAASSPRRDEANDPALSALRAERAQIEARLAAVPPPPPAAADNPYDDPSTIDPYAPSPSARPPAAPDPQLNLLKRRLTEINGAIQARRNALQQGGSSTPGISPALRAEWQRLLKAVAEAGSETSAGTPPVRLTARVITRAQRPTSPIEPDRSLLLVVGGMIALGVGVLLGVLLTSIGGRKPEPRAAKANEGTSASLERNKAATPNEMPSSSIPNKATVRIGSPAAPPEPTIPISPTDDAPRMPSEPNIPVPAPAPVPAADAAEAPAKAALPSLSKTLAFEPGAFGLEMQPPPPDEDTEPPHRSERRTSSHPPVPRGPVIEVNAPVAMRDDERTSADPAPPPQRLGREPSLRATQMFGSPLLAEELQPPPASQPPATATPRASSPSSSTAYSYVSTPPTSGPGSDPPPSPRRLRSHVSSRPGAEERTSSSPPSSSRSGQPVVSPRPVAPDWHADPSLVANARRDLCTELYPLAVEQCFVIGVTGLRKTGDDTARVAAELALALAETGHPRVLLLEGNLQRPSVQRWMRVEMPMFAGFTEQLDARAHSDEKQPWTVLECTPSLHVLAEGVMRTPELILSQAFEECVRELRVYYDFIVIDGPLTSELAACRAMQEVVDGVVLVSPRADAPELAEATALFSQKRLSTVLAAG